MLHVALLGSLAKQVEAFRSISLPTPLQWTTLPAPGEEAAQLDLLIQLRDDPQVPGQLAALGMLAPPRRFVAIWEEVPPAAQLDTAVQVSLTRVYGFIVGRTEEMHTVCRWIRAMAHPVSSLLQLCTLVVGESGTGKELVARAIHRLGERGGAPFLALNCGTIPRELAASTFFGHVKGAFSGAAADHKGYLEDAGHGILFLDELGELAPELQSQLLRVLDQRTFTPVGSTQPLPLRAQIVSATNRQLDQEVKEGRFRADLYFRIAQMTILLPPLRERQADLPLLVQEFLGRINLPTDTLDAEAERALLAHPWPGNIRQLRTALERWVMLRHVGDRPPLHTWLDAPAEKAGPPSSGATLAQLREAFDRRILTEVLSRCQGDTKKAALELGITRRSVYNLAHRYGIAVHPTPEE